jgi:hypothetical protein
VIAGGEITWKRAVQIGLIQCVAMIPGVSRSGATIVGGSLLGLSRRTIVEFSFLLAIPTMTAATGLELLEGYQALSGHLDVLAVGFVVSFLTALLAREIFIRTSPLRGSRWLPFVVVCFCLAFSAFYELIEFWTALASGSAATDFLGTQGDPWDTQWDMQLALIGAIVSLLTLSRVHDRQLGDLGVTGRA